MEMELLHLPHQEIGDLLAFMELLCVVDMHWGKKTSDPSV